MFWRGWLKSVLGWLLPIKNETEYALKNHQIEESVLQYSPAYVTPSLFEQLKGRENHESVEATLITRDK